jgi:LmbE family N-acetylglucosaminyl deacetylase
MDKKKYKIMAIGAHPDDCDFSICGIAYKLAVQGNSVHFLSMTNGNAGHYKMNGKELADRRYAEAQASARELKVTYDILDIDDGRLMPTLENRELLIRKIRSFSPDVIITNRPNDYHPDHRNTASLVQDCSYLLGVPNICPDTPAMDKNPSILFWQDSFKEPTPFHPEIVVPTDLYLDVYKRVVSCHVSQSFEWLIWMDGERKNAELPFDERVELVMKDINNKPSQVTEEIYMTLAEEYGKETADKVRRVECLQQSEYGSPLKEGIKKELLK